MKNILVVVLICLCSCKLVAQNKATKTADKYFDKLEFVNAITAYNKLVKNGKADAYVYKRLAEANYNIFNTVEAERWYAKALKNSKDAETIYRYAQMLKANGKYEASNTQMNKFAIATPKDARAKAFTANPNYLDKIVARPNKVTIKNLALNSKASDFGGMILNNKLYITSARNNSRSNYGWNKQPYLDIYSYTINSGTYSSETLLSNNINTKYHEGLVSFSPDGKTMYFSRESFFDKNTGSNTRFSVLHLFKSTKKGGKWGKAKALPINKKSYSIKNPSVSKDGKTLYFASDMPGGYGGFDIYKTAIKSNGALGKPKNLGNIINTKGQEMFPFISKENTLYFSSNGHLGLGGLDVFFITETNKKLSPLRNIGAPINSNSDDFAFAIDSSGNGFVSSNRTGGKGSDDIYAIKKMQPLCNVETMVTVKNSETGILLANAMVTLSDNNGNIITSETSNAKGQVLLNVECGGTINLSATAETYENNSLNISGTQEETLNIELKLDPIQKIIVADRVLLEPIYFDYNKADITTQGATELDKLVLIMKNYPNMVINAKSHTDNRGKATYNKTLSSKRAKSTVNYIISKGIETSRISGEGMGESDPLYKCGSKCTEEQHQANRRSEFIILSGGPKKTNN